MNKHGEIVVVEDDADDRDLLREVLAEIGVKNKVTILPNGQVAYDYLNTTAGNDLFLILSDINMPMMNGIELRDKMQQTGEMKLRTIPFLFMTTAAAKDSLMTAYAHSVQGFFQKPANYAEFKETIETILKYWAKCSAPTFH